MSSIPQQIYGYNYWYSILVKRFSPHLDMDGMFANVVYRAVKQFSSSDIHLLLDIWVEFEPDRSWVELFFGTGYIDILTWDKPAFGIAYYLNGQKVFVEKLGEVDDRFHSLGMMDSFEDVLWKAEIAYSKKDGAATFDVYNSPSADTPIYTVVKTGIVQAPIQEINVGSEVAATLSTLTPKSRVNTEMFDPQINRQKTTDVSFLAMRPYQLFMQFDGAQNPLGLIYTLA